MGCGRVPRFSRQPEIRTLPRGSWPVCARAILSGMELPLFRLTEKGFLSDTGELHRAFEQISNDLQGGKSLGDIASELGVSMSGLVDL